MVHRNLRSVLSPEPVYFSVGATVASAIGVEGWTVASKVPKIPALPAFSAVNTRLVSAFVDAPIELATPPLASLLTERMPALIVVTPV